MATRGLKVRLTNPPARYGAHTRAHSRNDAHGMSLIVVIALLAILSIFALTFLRAIIKEIDYKVAREESIRLKSYKQALEQSILRTAYIPGTNDWAQSLASELGASPSAIALNPRQRQRMLVLDTAGWLTNAASGISIPYGTTNPPVRARMMIVSSLGGPMPSITPYPAATNFSQLWDCREGQLPATAAYNGCKPEDLKVERIVLDPMFVTLRLATAQADAAAGFLGKYVIGAPTNYVNAPAQAQVNNPYYVLRGTKIWLYSHTQILDARQIVAKNSFFRYERGIWKSVRMGADLPGGLDLAAVVKGFLDATPNLNAKNGTAQQRMVVDSMMAYMEGYNAWCKAGFPLNQMKTDLLATQESMMDRCVELFGQLNGNNYYPVNNTACP